MDTSSQLRINSVRQLADLVLHSSTLPTLPKPESRAIAAYPPPVFRDIKLSNPLLDDSINDRISEISLESMNELSRTLSITLPQKFQNDSHVMNTCANILRHRKSYPNPSLLFFVVGVLMSKSELLSKTIGYFQKSLECKLDIRVLFDHMYYPPSEVLTRKVTMPRYSSCFVTSGLD